jgi:hypothetical protein
LRRPAKAAKVHQFYFGLHQMNAAMPRGRIEILEARFAFIRTEGGTDTIGFNQITEIAAYKADLSLLFAARDSSRYPNPFAGLAKANISH